MTTRTPRNNKTLTSQTTQASNAKPASPEQLGQFQQMQIKAVELCDGLMDAAALSGFLLEAMDSLGTEEEVFTSQSLRGLRVASRALQERHFDLQQEMRRLCQHLTEVASV